MRLRTLSLLAAGICLSGSALAKAPYIDPAEDRLHFATSGGMLFWTPEQRVAGFRNIDRILQTRAIQTGPRTLRLNQAPRDFSNLRYEVDGASHTLEKFMDHNNVVGLLAIKDGEIALERYASGNHESSRWISFSVAKSVVSMLVGAAIQDGFIESVDEKVTAYLPRLVGSSYDDASIRDVLQMASGVEWDETYDDPNSDVNTTPGDLLTLVGTLARKKRVAEPGDRFNYNTGETNLAGAILRAAIGNNLSTYLTQKIWQPFGMEHDASWLLDQAGGELGGCCINATLRDYGRLGLFALANGQLADGTKVLPDGWMQESTRPSSGADYYGYLWWLMGGDAYMAIGIYGQGIYVNPNENLVIAMHGSYETAVGDRYSIHRSAFLNAMAEFL
jgi:CubicO group peptidase (beta-lactamase class C family)